MDFYVSYVSRAVALHLWVLENDFLVGVLLHIYMIRLCEWTAAAAWTAGYHWQPDGRLILFSFFQTEYISSVLLLLL